MKRYEKIHTVLYMGTGYLSSNLGVYSAVLYNFQEFCGSSYYIRD